CARVRTSATSDKLALCRGLMSADHSSTGSDLRAYGTMKLATEHTGLALGYICKAQQDPLLAGAAHIGGRESVERKRCFAGTLGHAHVVLARWQPRKQMHAALLDIDGETTPECLPQRVGQRLAPAGV